MFENYSAFNAQPSTLNQKQAGRDAGVSGGT